MQVEASDLSSETEQEQGFEAMGGDLLLKHRRKDKDHRGIFQAHGAGQRGGFLSMLQPRGNHQYQEEPYDRC